MPQVARIESTLGLNDVEFTQGIERAEKRAQTFAGRTETAFQGLFKRTPGRKAERALSGLIGDLSGGGNIGVAVGNFASKITGLGLLAGVGVGAAVEVFDHLHSSVVAVREAHDQLDKQMSKPIGLTSIESLGSAIDNLTQKQNTLTHGLTNYIYDITHLKEIGTSGIDETKEISEAIGKRQSAERLRGRNELIQANVLAGIDDPKRKALAEMRFKFDEKRNALMASPDKGSADRLKALDVEQDAAEKNFRLQKNASNAKLEAEEKIQKLIEKGLSAQDERKVRIGSDITSLNNQIAEEKDPTRKRELQLALSKKQTELRSIMPAKQSAEANPYAFGTAAARQWESEQGGFGTIASRANDTNNASVFGSLAYNAAQRGETALPKAEEATPADIVKAVNGVTESFEKYWGSK